MNDDNNKKETDNVYPLLAKYKWIKISECCMFFFISIEWYNLMILKISIL